MPEGVTFMTIADEDLSEETLGVLINGELISDDTLKELIDACHCVASPRDYLGKRNGWVLNEGPDILQVPYFRLTKESMAERVEIWRKRKEYHQERLTWRDILSMEW